MASFMAGYTDRGGGGAVIHGIGQPDHIGFGVKVVRQIAADSFDADTVNTVGAEDTLGSFCSSNAAAGILI